MGVVISYERRDGNGYLVIGPSCRGAAGPTLVQQLTGLVQAGELSGDILYVDGHFSAFAVKAIDDLAEFQVVAVRRPDLYCPDLYCYDVVRSSNAAIERGGRLYRQKGADGVQQLNP